MGRSKYVSSLLALALVTGLVLVTACAPKKKLGEGAVTSKPMGYIVMCAEQPEHKLCKK